MKSTNILNTLFDIGKLYPGSVHAISHNTTHKAAISVHAISHTQCMLSHAKLLTRLLHVDKF